MRKKILHITKSLGGIETYIRGIIENIDSDKFEIILIAPFSESFNSFCTARGVQVYNTKRGREVGLINDFLSIFEFIWVVRKTKPDLIHLHSAKAGFIGRIASQMASRKAVFTPNALSYLSFTGVKRAVFFLMEVVVKRFTYRVLAVSYSEKNRLVGELGFDAKKVHVIYNAINLDAGCIEFKRPINSTPKIGTIARLTYQKNPILMVEIARLLLRQIPDARFYILGAGLEDHLKERTIALIQKYGLSDRFIVLNWMSNEETREFLKTLDVFILTSIFEGLPFSLLEAMSFGIPCVVSKCDGCNDVIQNNQNGFSCTTETEFVHAITALLSDSFLADKISAAGREYVFENHDMATRITELENFYLDSI